MEIRQSGHARTAATCILVVREADDDRHRILYKDLTKPDGEFVELIDRFEHQFHFIGNDGPVFYFMTNRQRRLGGGSSPSTRASPARRTGRRSFPKGRKR